MLDETDLITVVCAHCPVEAIHEVGWIRDHPAIACANGHVSGYDYNELQKFVREQTAHYAAKFFLTPHPQYGG